MAWPAACPCWLTVLWWVMHALLFLPPGGGGSFPCVLSCVSAFSGFLGKQIPSSLGNLSLLLPSGSRVAPSSGPRRAWVSVFCFLAGSSSAAGSPHCGCSLPLAPRPWAPTVSRELLGSSQWEGGHFISFMSAPGPLLVFYPEMPMDWPPSLCCLPVSLSPAFLGLENLLLLQSQSPSSGMLPAGAGEGCWGGTSAGGMMH